MKKKKHNKKSAKKKRIFVIIGLLVLVVLGVGGYFLNQQKKLKEPIKQEWGQKYYMYLKDVNENNKQEEAGLPEDLNKSKLSFYQVEDVKEPVMVIDYVVDQVEYSNVYYITNNKVNVLVYNQPSTIELLYNIENKKYDYYSHIKEDNKNKYKSIREQINDRIKELEKAKDNSKEEEKVEDETEYVFSDETVEKVTDVNGKEIVLDKFDETFVKPNIKHKTINYNTDLEEKDLKEAIEEEVEEYKPVEEIITTKTEKQVEDKVEEVYKTRDEMTKAKEEVAKKEAEEKAKKEQEEREKAEREGFKVGSYRLKYGRYVWDLAELGSPGQKETYILKSDKTCTHTDMYGKTTSCTFSVGTATDGQSVESAVVRPALKISENGGYSYSYFPTSSGFRDTDLEHYVYQGAQ